MAADLQAIVVGTGFGVLTHLRALRQAGFEVAALVGRDQEKTAKRAARMEVPLGLTSLDEALSLPDVSAVAVATPPHTHHAIVLDAIAAGKHVVCEKPFARNTAEAREMLAAAEARGVVHLLGTEFRWATGQALLRRVIKSGVIGEPRLVTFILQLPLIENAAARVPQWWEQASEGGGWLGAYASHIVDQIRYTLGDFEGVSASVHTVADRPMSADDSYTIHFRLRTGVEGVLQSSAGTYGPPVAVARIAGSRGTAWTQGDDVFVADRDGTRQIPAPDDLVLAPPLPPPADLLVTAYDMMHSMGIDLAPYTKLFDHLRCRILCLETRDDPPPATFADGVAGMEILDAIRQASAERRWVEINSSVPVDR